MIKLNDKTKYLTVETPFFGQFVFFNSDVLIRTVKSWPVKSSLIQREALESLLWHVSTNFTLGFSYSATS